MCINSLNTWRVDGAQDFTDNLARLRYFLSPAALLHYQQRAAVLDDAGELAGRVRYILPAEGYQPELVAVHTPKRWVVKLRYYLYESLRGLTIKDGVLLEVSLPVFYENRDPQYNPWGLLIDTPGIPARRIPGAEI